MGLLRTLFLKSGYTLLTGDVRKQVSEMASPVLPQELLQNARVLANREEALQFVPKGGIVAEIGVAYGDFSEKIINVTMPSKFFAIDTFSINKNNEPWGCTRLKESGKTHFEYYQNRFRSLIGKGIVEQRQGLSWEMLGKLPDHSLDFIYVDADHTYESLKKDIAQAHKKIKPNGLIQFNDYTLFDNSAMVPYGVYRAVNEFMIEKNYEMLYYCLQTHGFYDVVIRKKR
jgi:hypothetical protein